MTDPTRKYLLMVGFSLMAVFALFFGLGVGKWPTEYGLKVVKLPYMEPPAPKVYFTGKVPMPKDSIPLVDFHAFYAFFDSLPVDTMALDSAARDSVRGLQVSKKPKPLMIMQPYRPYNCGDSAMKRVLLIGDSQLEGLRRPVFNYCMANGYDLVASVCWYGSSTKYWGGTDTLGHFIRQYGPDHVIFAIGLNELFVNDFDDRRVWIDNILTDFRNHGVDYTWIGPAAWKEDKGIIDIMQEKVGDHFFASDKLTLARAKDGMHPSNDAARVWMDSVAVFMTKLGELPMPLRASTDPKIVHSPFILLEQPK